MHLNEMKKFENKHIDIFYHFDIKTYLLTLNISNVENTIQFSIEKLVSLKFKRTASIFYKIFVSEIRNLVNHPTDSSIFKITQDLLWKITVFIQENRKENEVIHSLLYPTEKRIKDLYDDPNTTEELRTFIKNNEAFYYGRFLIKSDVFNLESLEDPNKLSEIKSELKNKFKRCAEVLSIHELELISDIFNTPFPEYFYAGCEFNENISFILSKLYYLWNKDEKLKKKHNFEYIKSKFDNILEKYPYHVIKFFHYWSIKSYRVDKKFDKQMLGPYFIEQD